MNEHICNALNIYRDENQTILAKQVAYEALRNAGFTDDDIIHASNNTDADLQRYVFLA